MRFLLTILFSFSLIALNAQDKVIVKYFDSLWKYTSKENASFYTEFVKEDSFYKCNSYYYPSMKLYGKSTYLDTLFHKGIGKMVRYFISGSIHDSTFFLTDGYIQNEYYENGALKNSSICNNKSIVTEQFIYYQNGKLKFHDHYINPQKIIRESYEEDGTHSKIFTTVLVPALYTEGGLEGWTNYLSMNLRGNIPLRRKAPVGKYTVYVTFTIDESGRVTNVQAENDPGYGTKEEAIRVVSKSPKWFPATENSKVVPYHHKQGITFVVTEQK